MNTDLPDLPDGIYWPFERLPGVKLAAYAMACVETALKYSDEARAIYERVIRSWELPGCEVLMREFTRSEKDTGTWVRGLDGAAAGNGPLADFPTDWTDAFTEIEGNADFQKLLVHATNVIVIGFNRKTDLENRTPRILPEKAPYLGLAIVFHSLLDCLALRPELKGPRVFSIESLTEFVQFNNAMASNPTTRKGRGEKHTIVRTLRREGYTLSHFAKLIRDAEQWYKCRVNPGTIEAYIAELVKDDVYLERGNIETAIAPCDEATGYPRKWRR